ncbi:DUF3667 domain-containing protein [Oxalobacteraceae bacterium]|nr:DUF3667 domain-containing protein [Oxalobacteraceae bacterium]
MNPDPHSKPTHCYNCKAPVSANFCAECGQETRLHAASVREFLHEFIGHYVALEGKLWGTVGRLLFRPGALTNEYIAGRRVRFVQPLRIYLTMSVLFFALLKMTNGFEVPMTPPTPASIAVADKQAEEAAAVHEESEAAAGVPAHVRSAEAALAAKERAAAKKRAQEPGAINIDETTIEGWMNSVPVVHAKWQHFEHLSIDEKAKVFNNAFYHYAPYAMFCLMPFFALFLKVLYLGSGRRFGEHMLFALHSNAFAFAISIALLLTPWEFAKFLLWIWLLGYLPWAMQRVYQAGRFGTAWRWLTLMSLYSVTMGIGFLFTAGAGIMTAGH